MKKYIAVGSVLAALAAGPAVSADRVQYSGNECVTTSPSSPGLEGLTVTGSGFKVVYCPTWIQFATDTTMDNVGVGFPAYVKAKNIHSARLCVTRKHYQGIPGNSLPGFACGLADLSGGSIFSYDLSRPANTSFSKFDQPLIYVNAFGDQQPHIRSYGIRYQ